MHPFVLIIISIVLGACGQIAMKLGTTQMVVAGLSVTAQFVRYFTNIPILLGLALYTFSAVVWIFAIARVQLSMAYPMVASGYVLVVILSYLIFHEPVSILRVLGLFIVAAGVIVIANS
jgi:multidrug transporter EmrE-like cation transporter